MQKIGVTGEIIQAVIHREERVGMMEEERSDMMMIGAPLSYFSARNESSLWVLFPFSD